MGVSFANGIPDALNHGDPATAPDPLKTDGNLSWGWLSGFRFVKAEVVQVVDPGEIFGQGYTHLGSTGCTGSPQQGTVPCAKPNRNNVVLSNFDPGTNTIVADVAALFAGTNLSEDSQCHSSPAAICTPMFSALGANFSNGQPLATQSLYSVQ